MVEQMKDFISKLIKKTTDNSLNWKALSELQRKELGFPDFIDQIWEDLHGCEFYLPLIENSFYFMHDSGIVALIRIDRHSGKDGSDHDEYAIAIQIKKNTPPQTYNVEGLQANLSILYMAVLDSINKDLQLPEDLYNFMLSC